MSGDEVADRLRRLEDRAQISDLVSRYARVVDDRDTGALADLFAAGAVFESRSGRIAGRERIVAFFAQRFATRGPSFHTPHGFELQFTGDGRAEGVVTGHAEQAIDGATYWIGMRYRDEYVTEDGTWRFSRRHAQFVYALPLSELATALAAPDRVRWPGAPPTSADVG